MINFISNLPRDLRSGGFSAMNVAALAAIETLGEVRYVGPVNPPSTLLERGSSKAMRLLGGRGAFFAFSDRRLKEIAQHAARDCAPQAKFDFFHGFTPWIRTRPARPYVAWSDCTFHDYIRIYHDVAQFSSTDLARIEDLERRWLLDARRVMFTSRWACDRAIDCYGLDPSRVGSVGIFGEIDLPLADSYSGGRNFAFVSTNFEAKGGRTVLAALRLVQQSHPDATLTIIGDAPAQVAQETGVTVLGRLRKENPEEYDLFRSVLADVRAVVHPTRSDISPLLLVEAGCFGCPVIATRRFAIPDMIEDGVAGYLLDDPSDAGEVAAKMIRMLDDPGYPAMRAASWESARSRHTKSAFAQRLIEHVSDAVGLGR